MTPHHILDLAKCYLIVFDENGSERPKPDTTLASDKVRQALAQASPPYTDVFLISHGWNSDVKAAREQYERWIVAMATVQRDVEAAPRLIPGFKPLIIGLHWSSLAWADETRSADTPALFADEEDPSGALLEHQIDTWAKNIASTATARSAIRTILESALNADGADMLSPEVFQAYPILPPDVLQAYAALFEESGLEMGDESHRPGAEQEGFDPQTIVIEAQSGFSAGPTAPALLGIFGELIDRGGQSISNQVDRHRDILLSPLRQLSFWKMKERARIVGQTGCNKLLCMLQKSAPNGCRFHLMGHSFGCIVVSAAVAGAGKPNEPPQPVDSLSAADANPDEPTQTVDSLFLVQGAMSLWSYAKRVPYAGDKPGYFHRVVGENLVRGHIVTTRSAVDTALDGWYPLGARFKGQDLWARYKFPRFGATGSFGIQGLPGVVDLPMRSVAFDYHFAHGRVYNLDASNVIRFGSGQAGAHNDIAHPEVAHVFWAMVLADRSAPKTADRVSLAASGEVSMPSTRGPAPALIDPSKSTLRTPMARRDPLTAPLPFEPNALRRRWINVEIDDHEPDVPLLTREWYALAFDVDVRQRESAFQTERFIEDNLFPEGTDHVTLTIQLSSDDFQLDTEDPDKYEERRPLEVLREGRSRKARFDIRPRHDGRSTLRATIRKDRNFVQQMEVAFIVGATPSGPVEVVSNGREVPSAIAVMEPRDLSLVISRDNDGGGYECVLLSVVAHRARLRIQPAELAKAVDVARKEMLSVIMYLRNGQYVFQNGIKINEEDEGFALTTMARAGADLFRKIFLGNSAGADSLRLGTYIKDYLRDSAATLKVQVFADSAPIPWASLYVGDASSGAKLRWENFIGMRHIVEQMPLQQGLAVSTSTISSNTPHLKVSVNINKNIKNAAAEQIDWWSKVQTSSRSVDVTHRSTRDEVITALADGGTADHILYFYCHANASDLADPLGPDASTLGMTDANITLGELGRDAPIAIQLPGNPLVFINACESGALSPAFYDGFVPYFMAKGARGVVGTECEVPVTFGSEWAKKFFHRFLNGEKLGQAILKQRCEFLKEHRNPLGLLYAVHCDTDTQIRPAI